MLDRRAARASLTTCVCAAALAALSACSGSSDAAGSAASVTGSAAATGAASVPAASSPRASAASSVPAPSVVTESPSVAVATQPPVRIGTTAALVGQVMVSVGKVRAVTVTAAGPGEIAGPAVVVPVTVRNATGKPFGLSGLVVNAQFAGGVPAVPSDAAPSRPLPDTVRAGGTATGLYVFRAGPAGATGLRVEISSDNARKVLVFRR